MVLICMYPTPLSEQGPQPSQACHESQGITMVLICMYPTAWSEQGPQPSLASVMSHEV